MQNSSFYLSDIFARFFLLSLPQIFLAKNGDLFAFSYYLLLDDYLQIIIQHTHDEP